MNKRRGNRDGVDQSKQRIHWNSQDLFVATGLWFSAGPGSSLMLGDSALLFPAPLMSGPDPAWTRVRHWCWGSAGQKLNSLVEPGSEEAWEWSSHAGRTDDIGPLTMICQ